MFFKKLKNIIIPVKKKSISEKISYFLSNGKIPWSYGYEDYKWNTIEQSLADNSLLSKIKENKLPKGFGHRIDERIVEYPWIFSHLPKHNTKILDAGSTFNFKTIVKNPALHEKSLTIFTFAPEKDCFFNLGISYVYGDLRKMPFKDHCFDTIVSQSTIEHIDMDNSIYGYDMDNNSKSVTKSFSYLLAVKEMLRVLKPNGTLLLTFPYGKFENHGFFQQFDKEMLLRLLEVFNGFGSSECNFFRYEEDGWRFADKSELSEVISYNPHSGRGKLYDNAAHCRSVACIKFMKNS